MGFLLGNWENFKNTFFLDEIVDIFFVFFVFKILEDVWKMPAN